MSDIIETITRAIDMSIGDPLASRIMADDVITAIKDAGYAIVPVEPSEAMIEAGTRAMVAALLKGESRFDRQAAGFRAMIEAGGVKA